MNSRGKRCAQLLRPVPPPQRETAANTGAKSSRRGADPFTQMKARVNQPGNCVPKTPAPRPENRRPDSNRGPLHHELPICRAFCRQYWLLSLVRAGQLRSELPTSGQIWGHFFVVGGRSDGVVATEDGSSVATILRLPSRTGVQHSNGDRNDQDQVEAAIEVQVKTRRRASGPYGASSQVSTKAGEFQGS